MHRELTIVTEPKNKRSTAETEPDRKRDIFYLDAQALTRDCVTRELSRRMPDFNVLPHADVRELIDSGDARLQNAAAVILFVHADRLSHQINGDADHSDIGAELKMLERAAPDVARVLMSQVEVPEDILDAFDQHVRGYIPTTLPIDQVAEAIRFVVAGGTFVPQSILSLHSRQSPNPEHAPIAPKLDTGTMRFSPRQTQVLRMLWKGCSNKLIAYELRMCESTVKVHIRHIMKKLNVSNRTQVVLKTRPQLLEGERDTAFANPAGPDATSDYIAANNALISRANGILLGQGDGSGRGTVAQQRGPSGA
jgi:DNA-binding NarL/FixJ family response regulator